MSGATFRRFIAYVQTVLLISIIGSGMLFMHKHTTSSGQIVVHFHPYNLKTDPDATKHHHTENEIHFLDVVFHGSYIQTDFVALRPPYLSSPVVMDSLPLDRGVISKPKNKLFLRGPPLFV